MSFLTRHDKFVKNQEEKVRAVGWWKRTGKAGVPKGAIWGFVGFFLGVHSGTDSQAQ